MRTDFVGGRIHQVDTIKMSGTKLQLQSASCVCEPLCRVVGRERVSFGLSTRLPLQVKECIDLRRFCGSYTTSSSLSLIVSFFTTPIPQLYRGFRPSLRNCRPVLTVGDQTTFSTEECTCTILLTYLPSRL